MKRTISPEVETKIVALIARGDTYTDIVKTIESEDAVTVSTSSISQIKSRNESALAHIKDKLQDHASSRINRLISKTHKSIEKKLDKAEQNEQELEKLSEQYLNGQITKEEYRVRSKHLVGISITELANVSDKLFRQSQATGDDSDKLSANPAEAKQQLIQLLQVINVGDLDNLQKMIFEGFTDDKPKDPPA